MELNQDNQAAFDTNLPEGTESFSLQVAGHKPKIGSHKCGVLKHKNGNLVKPLIEGDRRSVTELCFYEAVFKNEDSDPLLEELQTFLPSFYGIWETNVSGLNKKFLSIEDVCGNFQNPSILDVKVGLVTYDKFATESKIKEQNAKSPYGNVIGFRIAGMKTYDEVKNTHVTHDKMFLRKGNVEMVPSILGLYLSSDPQINIWFLCGCLHKLHQLDIWFSKQKLFSFIASSILFVYEGTLSLWSKWAQENHILNLSKPITPTIQNSSELNNSSTPSTHHAPLSAGLNKICDICGQCESMCSAVVNSCPLFRVTLIDFAHTYPANEVDTNYIFGLHSTIKHFKLLLKLQKDILCSTTSSS